MGREELEMSVIVNLLKYFIPFYIKGSEVMGCQLERAVASRGFLLKMGDRMAAY